MQINSTAGAHYLPLFGASAPTGLAERQVDLFKAPVTSISAFLPLLRETWAVPANSDVIIVDQGKDTDIGMSYSDWVRETEEYQAAAEADSSTGTSDSTTEASASDEAAAEDAAVTQAENDDAAAEAAASDSAADQTSQSTDELSSGGGGLLGGLFGWN